MNRAFADRVSTIAEYCANFVVKPAYEKLVGRAADDAEVAYWTALTNNGLTDQQLQARLNLLRTRTLPDRILTDQ